MQISVAMKKKWLPLFWIVLFKKVADNLKDDLVLLCVKVLTTKKCQNIMQYIRTDKYRSEKGNLSIEVLRGDATGEIYTFTTLAVLSSATAILFGKAA
jgi:hypothetical protein